MILLPCYAISKEVLFVCMPDDSIFIFVFRLYYTIGMDADLFPSVTVSCGGLPCAVRALCEKLAVLHHREFGKFRRLKGRH